MKQLTTFFEMKIAQILSCLFLILFCGSTFYGQTKNYPTSTSNGIRAWGLLLKDENTTDCVLNKGLLCAGVDPIARVGVTGNLNAGTFNANMLAKSKDFAGFGYGGEAWVQFDFGNIPKGSRVYIPFSEVKTGGVGLDLLGTVLGLLSLIDKDYLNATVFSGDTEVEDNLLHKDIVVDKDGKLYLVVSSDIAIFDKVRFRLKYLPGLLSINLGSNISTSINSAFYVTNEVCGLPSYVNTGRMNTTLNVKLGDAVKNSKQAIDGNNNTFSSISFGSISVNVNGSVFQDFYFNGLSAPQDYFKVKLKLGGSALNLNVLGNYEVRAYKGNELVYTKKLQGALVNGLDLLGLLQSGNPVEIPFGPGVAFDRVAVGINSTVGVSLVSSPLEVYSVKRYGLGNSLLCKEITPPLVDEGGIHMLGVNKNCGTVLVGHKYANFPYNAIDGNNGTFSVLEATSGALLGAGAYSGNIHIGYNNIVNAGTTSYLRVDMGDNGLLSGLLNGSLGGLLGGVLDNVLFGNHYFTIDVYDNPANAPILSGSSANGFNGKPIKVIQDKFGKYYVAITPGVAYKSVKITEHFPSLVGAEASRTMKVYGLCYSTGSDTCEQGFATFSESSGITLDLLGLGAAGVIDAQNAIDGNIDTASKVSVGAVGITGSMFQHVQFHGLSSNRDHFRVKMKMQASGTVTASVIGSIMVKAYKGDVEVYSQRLNEQLIPGLDLLSLLSNGKMINLSFAPGVEFDRVAVGLSSLVAANVLANPLEIYSIERFDSTTCKDPEIEWDPKTTSPFNTPVCSVELGRFENVNFPYEAITDNLVNDTYATLTAGRVLQLD